MKKLEILKGINPKEFFKNIDHIIIYCFSIEDRHYFRFDDPLNTPYDRGLKTLVYYRELEMNCDSTFLLAHTQAFDNVFSSNKITIKDLATLATLNEQLKQRLQLPKEPELMYKLAAVVYFDQHENPLKYEFGYGQAKIKKWKEDVDLNDFFLSKPLRELIPYLEFAGENLKQFSQMISNENQKHLATLSPLLSAEQRMILQSKSK